MSSIFISHSTQDRAAAELLVDLLMTGAGRATNEIFCSSASGVSVLLSDDFLKYVKRRLKSSTEVIVLLSTSYWASPFCMVELGGAWVRSKRLIPFILPGHELSDFGEIVSSLQVGKLDCRGDLDRLKDLLAPDCPTDRWNDKCKAFLQRVNHLCTEQLNLDLEEHPKPLIESENQLSEQCLSVLRYLGFSNGTRDVTWIGHRLKVRPLEAKQLLYRLSQMQLVRQINEVEEEWQLTREGVYYAVENGLLSNQFDRTARLAPPAPIKVFVTSDVADPYEGVLHDISSDGSGLGVFLSASLTPETIINFTVEEVDRRSFQARVVHSRRSFKGRFFTGLHVDNLAAQKRLRHKLYALENIGRWRTLSDYSELISRK